MTSVNILATFASLMFIIGGHVAYLGGRGHVARAATVVSPISDAELSQLSEDLFNKDINSQVSAVRINQQQRTSSDSLEDDAPDPLLEVDPKALKSRTLALLVKLFDNYIPETNVNEQVTPEEVQEENAFLDAALDTPVLLDTMKFLEKKGYVRGGKAEYKKFLHKLWFTMFSRGGGKVGSSAFEHVFLGEIKDNNVQGFHSWPYFHYEESKKEADYKGWIKMIPLGNKGTLMKIRFSWKGFTKPVNGIIVGTSPELEMALYTLCFMARPNDKCNVSANGKSFKIQTYSWTLRKGQGDTIGSAYPIL